MISRNDLGEAVVAFSKYYNCAESVDHLSWFLGALVDGVSETKEEYLVFFSRERTLEEIFTMLKVLDENYILEINGNGVSYYSPIPIPH